MVNKTGGGDGAQRRDDNCDVAADFSIPIVVL